MLRQRPILLFRKSKSSSNNEFIGIFYEMIWVGTIKAGKKCECATDVKTNQERRNDQDLLVPRLPN